jgi:hypothetical protein
MGDTKQIGNDGISIPVGVTGISNSIKQIEKLAATIRKSLNGASSKQGSVIDTPHIKELGRFISNAKQIGRIQGTLKTFGINAAHYSEDLGAYSDIAKHSALTTSKALEKPIKAMEKAKLNNQFKGESLGFDASLIKKENIGKFTAHYDKLYDQFGDTISQNKRIQEAIRRTNKEVAASKMQFQGWALSIMFAGMAIKNAMMQIWSSSQKTFQEVMHSTEGTVTGFDMLDGSMKYLGFTVGQALEPIAMWLAPIIQDVAEWVSQNEELVQKLFVVGAALGFVLTAWGSITLAISGLTEAFGLLGITGESIGAIFGGMSLGASLGIFAALLIAWKLDLGKIKDFVSSTFDVISVVISESLDSIKQVFSGAWDIIAGIFTGDTSRVKEGLKKLLDGLVDLAIISLANIVALFLNSLFFIYNLMVDITKAILLLITGVIKDFVKLMIDGINKARGLVGLGPIKTTAADIDAAFFPVENSFKKTGEDLKIPYITGDMMKEFISGVKNMTDAVFSIERGIEVIKPATTVHAGTPYMNYTPDIAYSPAGNQYISPNQPLASGYGPGGLAAPVLVFNISGMTMDSIHELSKEVSSNVYSYIEAAKK